MTSHIVPVRGLISDFEINPDNWTVTNTTVTFSDRSKGEPIQWFWNFGDGYTLNTTQSVVIHSYSHPGAYSVNMTAINWQPVTKSIEKTYVVYEKSVPREVDFTLPNINQTGVAPFDVSFIDTTPKQSNVTSWLWDFGDGLNSVEKAPNHTYTGPGQYTVVLTVRNCPYESLSETWCNADYIIFESSIATHLPWFLYHPSVGTLLILIRSELFRPFHHGKNRYFESDDVKYLNLKCELHDM